MIEQDQGSIQKQLARPGSSLKKYQNAMVGTKGLLYLAWYELIQTGTGSFSGPLGLRLRSFLYSLLLQRAGKNIRIGRDCTMRRPHLVEIGNNVTLGENVALDVKSDGLGIRIGDNVNVGPETIFSCPGGRITLGRETKIGKRCRLGSLQGLTIGRACILGDYTYIVGAGHKYDSLESAIIDQPLICRGPSTIGDNVNIGSEVTVLDGIRIGDNVRIASGSLVLGDIPAGLRVAGVPARQDGTLRNEDQ